jgi:hypothetical protein
MTATAEKITYHPTAAKYKHGAQVMYITYDLEQRTRAGGCALYPKVKRVYIPGKVLDWQVGEFKLRSGRVVHGVKIDYEETREGYHREGYTARRGQRTYRVRPTEIPPTTQRFSKVVEIPEKAQNVQFHEGELPARYREALQDVR